MDTLFLIKEERVYNGAKRASSINGTGKTGESYDKMELYQCLFQAEKSNKNGLKIWT